MKRITRAGQFFALIGQLGAGKTTFVREWVRKRSPDHARQVVSPTFILHAKYDLPGGSVHHLDWYRLNSESEVMSLGWADILNEPYLAIFVEWADKFPSLLQGNRVDVYCKHGRRPDKRVISIQRIKAKRP